jgi:hypothetical protein
MYLVINEGEPSTTKTIDDELRQGVENDGVLVFRVVNGNFELLEVTSGPAIDDDGNETDDIEFSDDWVAV